MAIEIKAPAMRDLIDEAAPTERLGTGFTLTEGPIWNPREACLYFSDMPADVRRRWSACGCNRHGRIVAAASAPCHLSHGSADSAQP